MSPLCLPSQTSRQNIVDPFNDMATGDVYHMIVGLECEGSIVAIPEGRYL